MVRKEKSRSYVSSEPLPERGPGKDNLPLYGRLYFVLQTSLDMCSWIIKLGVTAIKTFCYYHMDFYTMWF